MSRSAIFNALHILFHLIPKVYEEGAIYYCSHFDNETKLAELNYLSSGHVCPKRQSWAWIVVCPTAKNLLLTLTVPYLRPRMDQINL